MAAGGVEFDEIIGGEGGSGEGGDDDLDDHRDAEEDADGELREKHSSALVVNILGVICIACALDCVQGEGISWV